MVLTGIGNTVLLDGGGGWEDKLARARYRAAAARRRPPAACSCGAAWSCRCATAASPACAGIPGRGAAGVHRHLRDLQLEDELAVLALLLRRRQSMEDLRAVAMAEAHARAWPPPSGTWWARTR